MKCKSTLKNRLGRELVVFLFAIFSMVVSLSARAGGGHSYHSSGGSSSYSSGGGGGGSSFHSYGGGYSSSRGSGSFSSLITLIILAVIIYFIWKKSQQFQAGNKFKQTLDPEFQSNIRKPAPTGSNQANQLKEKLGEAFVAIQNAWSKGSMETVRALLSDGVYHRFQIQLEMNQLQGFKNKLEQPTLLEAKVLKEETFGRYTSVDFLIRGRGVDTDIDLQSGKIKSTMDNGMGGSVSVFEEIWSFSKLTCTQEKEALQTLHSCPKCAAPLSDAGGSRCSHCNAILNSGALDWVLAEITQAEEWVSVDRRQLQEYYAELPETPGSDAKAWLSPQELEDRASVVFIRYQSALHKGKLNELNNYIAPELFPILKAPEFAQPSYHLSLGAVDLLGFAKAEDNIKAWIKIKYSGSPQPSIEGSYQEKILVFAKAIAAACSKSDLSSMACANCGAPIESSDQAKCAYCDNIFSNVATNWVLVNYGNSELLSELNQSRYKTAPEPAGPNSKAETQIQIRLLSAIIIASLEDRIISQSEENTIRHFARHFGMGDIFVDIYLKKAKTDPDSFKDTLDKPLALIWLNNLLMVAAADGKITPEEEALLISFARRNGIEEKQIKLSLQAAQKLNK